MRLNILIVFMAMLFSPLATAQTTELFDKLLFTAQNDTLPYRLLKPVNPGAEEKFPLVVFLHGAGERGNDNESQLKHISNLFLDTRNRGKYPCYVVAPQCPKNEVWADYSGRPESNRATTHPSGMVMKLIERLANDYRIDKNRIYLTGVSMGGFGTWTLLASHPNMFAAAIPICGGGNSKNASTIKHIPLWAFHGAKDEIVKPENSRKMIKALHDAGGIPGYTEYPDIEHDSWVQAYQEPHLLPWLFKQKLHSGDKD
jgi:predicted peptidase